MIILHNRRLILALGLVSVIPAVAWQFVLYHPAMQLPRGVALSDPLVLVRFGLWVLTLGLLMLYAYLMNQGLIEVKRKVLWGLLLFLGNVYAFPVFWYLHVWRPRRGASKGAS